MNKLSAAALLLFLVSACSAQGGFVFEDCGPDDAWIKFKTLTVSPQPVNILGKIDVEVEVETSKEIGREVSMSLNLKKSNLNNGFVWEVPCTNIGIIGDAAQGVTGYLGTCDYKGSCDFPFIQSWVSKNECPAFFAEYNVPCSCPFPAQVIKTKGPVTIDLAEFKDYMPSWLIEGGYKVQAELRDTTNNNNLVGCLKMDFDVTAKKPCPPALARLNACPK